MTVVQGTDGYADSVARFSELSESIDFAEIHRCILHLLPEKGGRVLDVGAGTGRDAAALAKMGYAVVAVDPMGEFLDEAKTLHPSSHVEWVSDSLPDLAEISLEADQFDFVLCHAVWQHISPSEHLDAVGFHEVAAIRCHPLPVPSHSR